MFKVLLYSILFAFATLLSAIPVSDTEMVTVANSHLKVLSADNTIISCREITDCGHTIANIYNLSPQGFIIVTKDNDLPPIIAYSLEHNINDNSEFIELITSDILYRLQNVSNIPEQMVRERNHKWNSILSNRGSLTVQYWPPQSMTTTGGWIQTEWSQSVPYNMFCPMDLTSNSRSYAGCPAIAMAQIVNYHATLNEKEFTDVDDYYHNYGGNAYRIDDDYAMFGFPSFSDLNTYLDSASYHMRHSVELTNNDKAALVFASGVLAEQVYSSGGSGTFNVGQAFSAYQRMNFQEMELLNNSSPDLIERITANMISGKPVHYAVVTPNWDNGHNVVLDGYNSEGFFHINFGWGGSADGWYQIPDEMPYGMTVCEGAIVDITPIHYLGAYPEEIIIETNGDLEEPLEITLFNDNSINGITIEDIFFEGQGESYLMAIHDTLPITLEYGGMITLQVALNVPVRNYYIYANMRIVHEHGIIKVPFTMNDRVAINENIVSSKDIELSNYPNPFNPETTIEFSIQKQGDTKLDIYNLKGQHIKQLVNMCLSEGKHSVLWNGTDCNNHHVSSGIYIYKLDTGDRVKSDKMILLK